MKKSSIIFWIIVVILVVFLLSSNIFLISKVRQLGPRIDTLQKYAWIPSKKDKNESVYDRYYKFKLGSAEHKIVDRFFYISNIETVYRENGFQVSGIIGNITSMSMSIINIECAISDSTQDGRVSIGFTELPYLYVGWKNNFEVFIPTSKKDVREIGIRVKNYRM